MHRRELLLSGLAVAGPWPASRSYAQPASAGRGAIVIGVDKAGPLPKLAAAASGALEVVSWLRAEGFEVKPFVDDKNPVSIGQIKAAIRDFVERGTLQQLVVYFAGHGFISGTNSEFWLLSEAPVDLDAAISLTECRALSRSFDIPNVVFISDACRSRADSLGAAGVRGSVIFPGGGISHNVTTEVDVFLATQLGSPAYEVSVEKSVQSANGIYTRALLDAFRRPCTGMVRRDGGKPFVPTRKLKEFLKAEVPRRAREARMDLEQHPDAEVCSDENAYIAHTTSGGITCDFGQTPALSDVARAAINLPSDRSVLASNEALTHLARSSGFERAQKAIVAARGFDPVPRAGAGFMVIGQTVKDGFARPDVKVQLSVGQFKGSLVDITLGTRKAASIALRFADGSGTVLAALQNYVGTVVVEEGRVVNVSYAPTPQSGMRSAYEAESKRLDSLHASVAAAARFGVLRFEGPKPARDRAAEEFAEQIRSLKGVDPTLGLYAAYAYAEADLISQVQSVRSIMRRNLDVDFFDLAMLSGALSGKSPTGRDGIVPFVPMLSQGWGLLRVRDVRLEERLIGARESLRRSLWTTLEPGGMELVISTLRSGRVQ